MRDDLLNICEEIFAELLDIIKIESGNLQALYDYVKSIYWISEFFIYILDLGILPVKIQNRPLFDFFPFFL